MTAQPTPDEIRQFVDTWQRLCEFEAAQRIVRRQGVFDEQDTLPIPACVKVHDWLISLRDSDPLP